DRRELRGAKILAAWLGHFDSREQNSLDVWVEDQGRSYVRHYYIDFGSSFGSRWPIDAMSRRFGFSYYFDTLDVLGDLFSLGIIDRHWVEYLTGMEDLRQEIGLQAIAQRDPLIEYQRQAYTMFEELKNNIERDVVYQIIHVSFQYEQTLRQFEAEQLKRLVAAQQATVDTDSDDTPANRTVRNDQRMPGRNDPCPCGSGRKFKVCHLGREQELLALLQKQGAAKPAQTTTTPVARGKQRR
ncbi:MAG: hypothetical protein EBS29_12690, partial [Chloroflexia bacterium]|nr:hypothetical protein [Chloroflexia bacterium]